MSVGAGTNFLLAYSYVYNLYNSRFRVHGEAQDNVHRCHRSRDYQNVPFVVAPRLRGEMRQVRAMSLLRDEEKEMYTSAHLSENQERSDVDGLRTPRRDCPIKYVAGSSGSNLFSFLTIFKSNERLKLVL